MTPASEGPKATAQSRIGRLESNVSDLWTAVRNLETQLGGVAPEAARLQPLSQIEDAALHKRDVDDSDSDSNSTSSGLSPKDPPTHLLQLFDNGLLSSDGYGPPPASRPTSSLHQTQGSSALRHLMPSREDMVIIIAHASSWMSMYRSLFPLMGVTKASEDILSQYDKLQDPNVDLVQIATLLLTVAITVQQAPEDTSGHAAKSIRNASSFVKDVSDAVERIIVSDDTLAGTLEGIEITLLFVRL